MRTACGTAENKIPVGHAHRCFKAAIEFFNTSSLDDGFHPLSLFLGWYTMYNIKPSGVEGLSVSAFILYLDTSKASTPSKDAKEAQEHLYLEHNFNIALVVDLVKSLSTKKYSGKVRSIEPPIKWV